MNLQCCYLTGFANVELPKIFTDSMVLQRSKPIRIWGWAGKHEQVSITFHGQSKTVRANKSGEWNCVLIGEAAGGPYTLTVSGKNTLSLKDILMGDVWICSGQSNMEYQVKMARNAGDEILQADYAQIRGYKVPHQMSGKPEKDFKQSGKWNTATSGNVGGFTAVGYFFARDLYNKLHIPIGIIDDSWGGSNIETWISHQAFVDDSYFSNFIKTIPPFNVDTLTKYQAELTAKKLQELQKGLSILANVKLWKGVAYNDSNWPKMKLPGIWPLQQLDNVKGVVWYRKTFHLDTVRDGITTLKLPFITQSDSTYINGVLVGDMFNSPPVKRSYNIPAKLLKIGNNVISIRISDTTGIGGMAGDANDLRLLNRDTIIALSGDWAFQVEKLYQDTVNIIPNSYPSLLYNAMINPITSLAIKGMIWYQGESNAGRAYEYRHTFPLLINNWRKHWQQGDFPFLFVQLTNFNWANGDTNKGSLWAELREAQTCALALPNTGMAVTVDIGDANDLHPKDKQNVGKRLSAIALQNTYGQKTGYQNLSFVAVKFDRNKAILTFKNRGKYLTTSDKNGYVRGFEVAGSDHNFYYASAVIDGNNVTVCSPKVDKPVAVRYAWADDVSDANVFSNDGYPLAPFRTDSWKGITENARYRILQIF